MRIYTEQAEYRTWVIDDNHYCVKEVTFLDSSWNHIDRVSAIVPDCERVDKYYLITKNKSPYLVIEVTHKYKPWEGIHGYSLWHNYLLVARVEDFYCVNIVTHDVHIFPENEEFGYCDRFYIVADNLLATSNERIYRFDNEMHLVWQTEELAVDGVLMHYFDNNRLRVDGCNDPPYEWGWDEYVIDFATGEIIEGKNRWS